MLIQGPRHFPHSPASLLQMVSLQPLPSSQCKVTLQQLMKLTPHRLRSQHVRPGPQPHPPRGCLPCWQGCRAQQKQPAAARPPQVPPAALHVGCWRAPALCSCQAATQGRADMSSTCLLSERLCRAWAVQGTEPVSQRTSSRSAMACEGSPAALHAQPGRQCHPGRQLSAWQG